MSKLTNLKGRINYISSHARQENLYAVYETTERKFWRELAKCNQEEFAKSGTEGKCIEARELIIALPESFTDYGPDALLKLFTEHFKQNYGTECIAALHHNKRKTNYHIHLIFSERKLLEEPIEKIATRNMFYNENGKHVRTKKEILDEAGQVRQGCKIVSKGEVYECKLFTVKDTRFKSENFLDEIKRSYTDFINIHVRDDKERLQVFDRNGVYLPMKKIGKNNPKAERIKADNEMRKEWNQTVDRALVSGVPERQVMQVKYTEISCKARESVKQLGRQPQLFVITILLAIAVLELLITQIFKLDYQRADREKAVQKALSAEAVPEEPQKTVRQNIVEEPVSEPMREELPEETIPKQPKKSPLAKKYLRLSEIHNKLEKQNYAIYQREQQLSVLKQELDNTKGIFKGKQRKELREQIDQLKPQIENMKRYLSNMVQEHGYKTVKEFMKEHSAAKAENAAYKKEVADWEKKYGIKAEPDSVMARLEHHKQQVKKRENSRQRNYYYSVDRGAR